VKAKLVFKRMDKDIIKIYLTEKLIGQFRISIWFKVPIRGSLKGCYICRKDMKKMITTHFEPTYARRALPCLDEPFFKSLFNLKIKVSEEWNVVSNMHCSTEIYSDIKIFTFNTSPIMPVYLLHWTIFKHNKISTSLPYTVISLYDSDTSLSNSALLLAKESLQFYSVLFDIPYSLPKLDIISTFSNRYSEMSVQAMENWGCITFQSASLENWPNQDIETYIVNSRVVCHEIAHMWFGNLVTISWWTDIWLNEGFARYMEYKCLEKTRPEFRPWFDFVVNIMYNAMNQEQNQKTPHTVEILWVETESLGSYFDYITYLKGACVLRMMEEIMGTNVFDQAIRQYLKKFMWRSVCSDDFFETMDRFCHLDIAKMMRTWTKQVNFPLITVNKISDDRFEVSQSYYHKRFISIWVVPITYIASTGEIGKILLRNTSDVIEINAKWIKINYKSTCYYRVLYNQHSEIFEDIHSMCPEDRYGLAIDAISHYKLNFVNFSYVSCLIRYLIPEYEYYLISLIVPFLSELIQHSTVSEDASTLLHDFIIPLHSRFGFQTEITHPYLKEIRKIYIPMLMQVEKGDHLSPEVIKNEIMIFFQDFPDCAKKLLLNVEHFPLLKAAVKSLVEGKERLYLDIINAIRHALRTRIEQGSEEKLVRAIIELLVEEEGNYTGKEVGDLFLFYIGISRNIGKLSESLKECERKLEVVQEEREKTALENVIKLLREKLDQVRF
jgi:hypothetical protein